MMKIQICSKTKVGKYAIISTLVFILLMILKFFTYSISFPVPAIAALGLAGFILGAVSMIKNRDRSLFTVFSVLVGLLIILWITGETL